jgi:hypothetical protein
VLHQILQILWVMNCSGGKFTVVHNNYEFYQNYCGLEDPFVEIRVLLSSTQYCQACFNVLEYACSAVLFHKPSR